MKNLIDTIINTVLGTRDETTICVQMAVTQSKLNLHRELIDYAMMADGCSGYSGHCPCANNPCMICSSAH